MPRGVQMGRGKGFTIILLIRDVHSSRANIKAIAVLRLRDGNAWITSRERGRLRLEPFSELLY